MAAVVDLCDDSDSERGPRSHNPTAILEIIDLSSPQAEVPAVARSVARARAVSNSINYADHEGASNVASLSPRKRRRQHANSNATILSQVSPSAKKPHPAASKVDDLHVQSLAASAVLPGRARREARRAANAASQVQSQIPPFARKAPPEATTMPVFPGHARRDARRAAAAAETDARVHFQISPYARKEATPIEDDLNVKPRAVAKRPAAASELLEIVSVTAPPDPLAPIYEVFPDVERSHAQELLSTHPNVATVLMVLANGEYPREKQTAGLPTAHTMHNGLTLTVKRSTSAPKYDYLSPSSFEPSIDYRVEAGVQLLHDFPFLSKQGIVKIMHLAQGHYSIAREYVVNALMGMQDGTAASVTTEEQQEEQYRALKQALTTLRPDAQQVARFGRNYTVKRARSRSQSTPTLYEPILQEEIEHARQKLSKWMDDIEQRLKRKKAREYSQMAGTAVECSCCFDKVDMDEMVACKDEGHLFCVDCLKGYAESQIFSSGNLGIDKETKKPLLELKCPHGDGCDSGFQEAYLQKALPFKTLEKYNELQFRAAVELAGLREDLCTCPKCGYQADLPPTQMIFQCPMEDCRFESCRKCGKEPHIPLRCEEVVQKKRQDEGRLKVEEAISAAKIRTCPKCSVSFIKSDGCNKMTCSCGVWMCYICRQLIPKTTGYGHFCQSPHCDHSSCKKCRLYSKAEEDDEMAMKEAGVDAAESFREELLKDSENNAEGVDVNIDVSAIMQDPTASARKKKAVHQAAPGIQERLVAAMRNQQRAPRRNRR